MTTMHRHHLPAATHPDTTARADAEREQTAARRQTAATLQTACGRWLVIWSPWRQTFTAFACFTATPTIIDEADAAAFLNRVRQVELASGVGQ